MDNRIKRWYRTPATAPPRVHRRASPNLTMPPADRTCPNCQSRMPGEECGTWIVAVIDDVPLLLCSRECEAQAEDAATLAAATDGTPTEHLAWRIRREMRDDYMRVRCPRWWRQHGPYAPFDRRDPGELPLPEDGEVPHG